MLFEVLLIIILVVTSLLSLLYLIPYTSYGWTQLLTSQGTNVLVIPITESRDSDNPIFHLLGFGFLLLVIWVLPFLAKMEEDIFRRGKIELNEITKNSILFGLIHLLVGIPLAAGIALINTGFFYAYIYRRKYLFLRNKFIEEYFLEREIVEEFLSLGLLSEHQKIWEDEAVLEVTAYHTLYNTILMLLLLLTFFL